MSHMRLEVVRGDFWEVDGLDGREWIPAEHVRIKPGAKRPTDGALAQYVQGSLDGADVTLKRGHWGARYSASGFLDQTDWIVCATEEQARKEAIDTFGSDFACPACGEDNDPGMGELAAECSACGAALST